MNQIQPTVSAQLIWNGGVNPPYPLYKMITTIGRNASNDIILDDPKVSSFHANILLREDGYHLLDMKSRNGSTVNDKKVSVCRLVDGDELQFGDQKLAFESQAVFARAHAPLTRLSEKIQTMATVAPQFRKETDEILLEVEEHRKSTEALIDYVTQLADSPSLSIFSQRLRDVFQKLFGCGQMDFYLERTDSDIACILLHENNEIASQLDPVDGVSHRSGLRVIKPIAHDLGPRLLLAFHPGFGTGWAALLTPPLSGMPREMVMDLADVLLLFSGMFWKSLYDMEELHHRETDRIVHEKERESRERIHILETQKKELDDFVNRMQNRLVYAEGSPMEKICTLARKLASVELPVLINGETGTGKTYIAQLLHAWSSRQNRGFHVIDCSTIPGNLLESELFGHEKGAFTGAQGRKIGKVEAAAGGTLFLDEIGDLPLELQGKLLRFVQEGRFERLGGNDTQHVDVRIVAATNYDLEERCKQGKFRQDLFYRLHVLPLQMPPLRDHTNDIPLLSKHFILKHFNEADWVFTPDAIEAVTKHPWPGNIRELENKLQRAWIFHSNKVITAQDLGLTALPTPQSNFEEGETLDNRTLDEYREEFESAILKRCLKFYKGNITKCADHLKISRNTCKAMLRKYRLKGDEDGE